jgi:2-polyprenyl-3-methyl-5-hydroxy-6-metoxy-1,4-benzoquinol methylase
MLNNEIERLEEISDFYEKGDLMDEMIIDREIILVKKTCKSFSNAIEIGCGNGYSTQRLYPLFKNYEVVEPATRNIQLLNKRMGKEIICHNMLLENFIPEKLFDNIVFLNIIEHVEDPVQSLKEVNKILADNGQVYISAPNCMSLNRRAGYNMGLLDSFDTLAPKDYLVGHRRLYTVEMMEDHCRQAGLMITHMKGIYLKPLSESMMYELGMDTIKAFYDLGEDVPQYCACLFAVAEKIK